MSRLIDSLPEPKHVREKKLIVLSRSRVGTYSLYNALKMVGFKCYHMYETVMAGPSHMDLFAEAIRCKYAGQGKPYGKAEFDKWLGDYDAVVEIPQFFVEEFIEFYPNAKFLITERTPESWTKSLKNTAGPMFKACRTFPLYHAGYVDPWLRSFRNLHHALEDGFFHGKGIEDGMADAIEDAAKDRRLAIERVPKDQLLICKLEDGFGWEEFCPFLGIDIPATPYPKGNAPADFKKLGEVILGPKLIRAGIIGASCFLVPVIGIGAWYYNNTR